MAIHAALKLSEDKQAYRRDLVFMIMAAVFLGSLTLMNVLGVSRLIDLSFTLFGFNVPMIVPIGVLPYPVTFLCADIVCEIYGSKKANLLVLGGLIANLWMFAILWGTGLLPGLEHEAAISSSEHPEYAFYQIRAYALGGMMASLLAYGCAQFLDVYLYGYLRNLTKGKHLWLRNNVSTMVSQLVDTVIVVVCAYTLVEFALPPGSTVMQLIQLIASSYVFKFIAALLDTLPFYAAIKLIKRYLVL